MTTTTILSLLSIALFVGALRSNSKSASLIFRFFFGVIFMATYYSLLNLTVPEENRKLVGHMDSPDPITAAIVYLSFFILYFSSILTFFVKQYNLFYVPLIIFGVIECWSMFVLDGQENLDDKFIEIFIPVTLAFLPLYYLAYVKLIKSKTD